MISGKQAFGTTPNCAQSSVQRKARQPGASVQALLLRRNGRSGSEPATHRLHYRLCRLGALHAAAAAAVRVPRRFLDHASEGCEKACGCRAKQQGRFVA